MHLEPKQRVVSDLQSELQAGIPPPSTSPHSKFGRNKSSVGQRNVQAQLWAHNKFSAHAERVMPVASDNATDAKRRQSDGDMGGYDELWLVVFRLKVTRSNELDRQTGSGDFKLECNVSSAEALADLNGWEVMGDK